MSHMYRLLSGGVEIWIAVKTRRVHVPESKTFW
jgi:hypothetical protein